MNKNLRSVFPPTDDTKADGQYKKTVDITKLITEYNQTNPNEKLHFTSIEEGIKQSVLWFVENYNVCRK